MHCCDRQSTQRNKKIPVDPVCGMEVKNPNTKLVTDYLGRKYYFCDETCMKAFQELHKHRPDSKRTPVSKKKGIWGRYLDRLNKTTGGKPLRCH